MNLKLCKLWLRALALIVWLAPAASAAEHPATVQLSPAALSTVRRLAVQRDGRVKPFDSFAWETLDRITGSARFDGQDPTVTVLSIMTHTEAWQDAPLLSVPYGPLREAIGLDRKTTHVSYNSLVASRKLMRLLPAIVAKQQNDAKLSMLEQETMDAYDRFVSLSGLFEQQINLVPPLGRDEVWLPIFEPTGYSPEQQAALREAWTTFTTAARDGKTEADGPAATALAAQVRAANPSAYPAAWRLSWEVWYNHIAPFRVARLFYWLACLGLALSLRPSWKRAGAVGLGALWVAFGVHLLGIVSRVVLGGRPPVSNFYETMLWLPFVAVAIALIFQRIYGAAYFGMAASALAAIVLILADHLPLDSSISPVVAVLRSNLWLTIHVLTIVASYGALALATMLAHIYAGVFLTGRDRTALLASLELFLYRAIQVGIVLLAGGVMLGAVWANASWGRYWGWDPKETWALITLLWFLALLHGRFAGWLKGVGLAVGTIGGFFLLLMTYYGVSFYLVGLHSYAGGHAKPIPPLLVAYLIAEAVFMVVLTLAARRSHT